MVNERERIVGLLMNRGIIESEFDFSGAIYVISEDEDHYEVVIDGTFMIKKEIKNE